MMSGNTMKEETALITGNDDGIVVKEANTWLTNFISDRTQQTYKKAIEEFALFAEFEQPDDLFDVDSATVLSWREHLIGLEYSNNSVANRLSALS
jgi:site-specific recombinase XerD